MPGLRNYKILFGVAGLYNFVGSLPPLLLPESGLRRMYSVTGPHSPVALLGHELFWISVFLFGVGYCIVALNPLKNHGIIILAILGKGYVGLRWVLLYFSGQATTFALLGGLGDVLFALIFIPALLRLRMYTSDSN